MKKCKKQKRNDIIKTIVIIVSILALFTLISFNASVCTGAFEGDINAKCVKIIK